MKATQEAPKVRRPRPWSRMFVIALALLATVLVIRSLAPQTLGETARRQFLAQLRDHYRGYSISIRRGHFDPKVGLTFEDIRIRDESSPRFRSTEVIRIERMTVFSDIHAEKLLDQKNPLTTRRIVLDGVQANVWLTDDEQISLMSLLPLPNFGPVAPRMDLRRVKVHLHGNSLESRPVSAELNEVVVINKPNAEGGIDKSIAILGATDFANGLDLRVHTKAGSTVVRGTIQGAYLSHNLIDRLPRAWAKPLLHAKDLQCACDVAFAIDKPVDAPVNYRFRGTVHDGRFAHPSLPKPISQLRGIITCDPRGITIESSQGTLGDAIVRLTGRINGHRWPCEANLKVDTRGLLLDDRLAAALPPSMRIGWSRIQPLGRVDVDANLFHTNSNWTTNATVICKGVDVRYEKFPYPVESLVGRIDIRHGIASTKALDGRIGGNRMQCAFSLPIKPGITKEKSFVIASEGPVPVDNTLIDALSPQGSSTTKLEAFVRSLRPRGSVHLASAVIASDAEGRQTRKVDLRVIDGVMQYENFAYPLYNVAGKIKVDNDVVTLSGFRATNANAGTVFCSGAYRMPPSQTPGHPSPASPARLELNFRASNVPMDESLRRSLPVSTQQVWDAISPSGILDELNVVLTQDGDAPLGLDVTARQHDHQQVTNRSLSLRPSSLPYRIDVTGGAVHFDGSQVTIDSIRGRHDASTLSADGRCVQDAGGRWILLLNLHSGSRLHPDAELIAALPSQMREAMRALQLRGPVSVRGKTELALPDSTHAEPAIQWDLALQLEGNRIADVSPVHSIRGELNIKGMRDELGIRADGDVRIDSMHVYDLQIVGIRGPFSIEDDRLYLGGQSSAMEALAGRNEATTQAPSIRGKMFDGTIDLDGEVVLSSGNFDVGLAIRDGHVPTLLADFGSTDSGLTGTFSGQTQLVGNLGSTDLLKGSGAARLTGAKLYELPLIVQLLTLLRLTPTEHVAFTDGQVEFTVFGDTLTFNDLQIWGDLVSLHGGGTLDRKRELDLTFNTRVSPQNSFTRVFRPLRSQRYTLWTIDVRGPLHSPNIERRALEGVGETLERIFPVMGDDDDPEPDEKTANRFIGNWFR